MTRYREQAANLRHISNTDLWSFMAFMAIQLVLAEWVSHTPLGSLTKSTMFLIDVALMSVCVQVLWANQRRRADVRATIININEAFALYAADVYLPDRAINPPPQPSPYIFYGAGYWAGLICVAIALYFGAR
jgi:hypothetical protein